jgi:hypothetical protein
MSSSKPIKHFFNDSIVTVYPENGYTLTEYEDGTNVPAMPNYRDVDLYMANELGYTGLARTKWMTIEHEILHTFICEEQGLLHSPTLWSVAHNNRGEGCIPEWQQYEEEALILSFQKYLNSHSVDPILADFDKESKIKIPKLRDKALVVLDFIQPLKGEAGAKVVLQKVS